MFLPKYHYFWFFIIDERKKLMLSETKSKLKILFLIIIFGCGIFFYVRNVISINALAYENYLLRKQIDNIIEENLILMKKINELESPNRIIPLVETKLGMKPPTKPPVIIE